jgi:hypothetical protein
MGESEGNTAAIGGSNYGIFQVSPPRNDSIEQGDREFDCSSEEQMHIHILFLVINVQQTNQTESF